MNEINQVKISGTIVDVLHRKIFPGAITIENGRIARIEETDHAPSRLILPGFIDGHVHIESSMLVPTEFARLAVRHGTVATVSDPHEIANVLGMSGVEFMLDNAAQTPFKFNFTAPSCVPATPFETAGAHFGSTEIETLIKRSDIVGLSEMMNVPGVLNADPEVTEKLAIAARVNKPVDGHAPELQGPAATAYIHSGISTDHECVSLPEALEKLEQGMLVQIREGSAAKNLDDLIPLLEDHFKQCMLCSDDKHPDDLLEGHINEMVRRAIAAGIDPLNVLWSACITPVHHYQLPLGLLQQGDPADFIILKDFESCQVLETWIDGNKVADRGENLLPRFSCAEPNRFAARPKQASDFQVYSEASTVPVIQVIDGQLVTRRIDWQHENPGETIQTDPEEDILKISVLNRYSDADPAVAFIRGFGLHEGALVSSVAHDSHNIVAVGTSDEFMASAMNEIIKHGGGVAAIGSDQSQIIPLPVAGIMSSDDAFVVGHHYADLDELAKQMGSTLQAPFMTLSFMALLVIPALKLSDKGLFDGERFVFLDVFQKSAQAM